MWGEVRFIFNFIFSNNFYFLPIISAACFKISFSIRNCFNSLFAWINCFSKSERLFLILKLPELVNCLIHL
ncbi:hypothetical protein [Spiroplasma ixodetis]|uniref:hypothetical protein n=1 Tax=Spiroplasma ixodetis TaxID=2141 RepID=UPI003D7C3A79